MPAVMLITGGTGSLGRALVKEVLKRDVKTIRIYSRNEFLQWEMKRDIPDARLRFLLGDVRDRERLYRALDGVDTVVHAAALKHIAFCQYNPIEAVKTNILGSINVVDACIDAGVKQAIAISSDKAVHPVNIYGATKLCLEHLWTKAGVYGNTQFACIRSGNFLGSQGSVIPLWDYQAITTGRITITDPSMSRYWISLEDISRFVLRCLDNMQGGEIFVPKMNQCSIGDLAVSTHPNIPMDIIGCLPGERMNEPLFADNENPVEYEGYYVIR